MTTTTLSEYITPTHRINRPENRITLIGKIPVPFQNKTQAIVKNKGYSSNQDYFNALMADLKKENPNIEELLIPYEALKLIDEEYLKLNYY